MITITGVIEQSFKGLENISEALRQEAKRENNCHIKQTLEKVADGTDVHIATLKTINWIKNPDDEQTEKSVMELWEERQVVNE